MFRAATCPGLRTETLSLASWQQRQAQEPDDAERLAAAIADPVLREAITVSSPSLGRLLDEVAAGREFPAKQVRRAARSVSRYQRRMSDRATPFGLMAGVAVARFGDAAEVAWEAAPAKAVRPSREWLTGLVSRLEQDMGVLRQLHATVNDLVQVRGDRLCLSYRPVSGESTDTANRELTLRCTPPVRTVLDAAARPARWTDLLAVLKLRHAELNGNAERLLAVLVQHQVLLTDLLPPAGALDPLGHIAARLSRRDETGALAAELTAVSGDLARYASTPLGGGLDQLRAVTARLRGIHQAEQTVAVDLRLGTDVRLPPAVRTEVERAAQLLCRLSARYPEPVHLRDYRGVFTERYGFGRAVPVLELLDPETGIGAPAGYQYPPCPQSARSPGHQEAGDDPRDETLLALAQQAAADNQREVVLDAELLERLAGSDEGDPPPSLDLLAELRADSTQALTDGDFALIVRAGACVAGSVAGRFSAALGAAGKALGDVFCRLPSDNEEAVRAQLIFRAPKARGDNVTFNPRFLERAIVIGEFADQSEPGIFPLADLAVLTTQDRFAVISRTLGREVVATLPNMLAPTQAPNAARLLDEIARSAHGAWPAWRWGAAGRLAFLPRVRYGRTLLSLARWTPDDPVLRDRDADPDIWAAHLDAWLSRWHVPPVARCVSGDQKITVNLADARDRDLLRDEWTHRAGSFLEETAPGGTRWLDPGGRAHEFAFSLVRAAPSTNRVAAPAPARPRVVHGPGSDWLYAKLYCSGAHQDEILVLHLPRFAEALPAGVDRWFFIRYSDPEPHLRLRFRGRPAELCGRILPRLWEWSQQLMSSRLSSRLTLDGYEPEIERYGGPEAMAAAERVFDADSRSCLLQLRLLRENRQTMEPGVLAAANYLDILAAVGQLNLLRGPHADSGRLALERTAIQQVQALAALDGRPDQLADLPGGGDVRTSWRVRAQALTAYRDLIDEQWTDTGSVLGSLLHMHHNRLVGGDRDAEEKSLALARRALKAHDGRVAALAPEGAVATAGADA